MIQEYDVVITIKDVNDKVLKGMKGVVLIVHNVNPPKYEVEFVNEDGFTIDLLTLTEDDIAKWTA